MIRISETICSQAEDKKLFRNLHLYFKGWLHIVFMFGNVRKI